MNDMEVRSHARDQRQLLVPWASYEFVLTC